MIKINRGGRMKVVGPGAVCPSDVARICRSLFVEILDEKCGNPWFLAMDRSERDFGGLSADLNRGLDGRGPAASVPRVNSSAFPAALPSRETGQDWRFFTTSTLSFLSPGEVRRIDMEFVPRVEKGDSSFLMVSTNDPFEPSVDVPLISIQLLPEQPAPIPVEPENCRFPLYFVPAGGHWYGMDVGHRSWRGVWV